MFAKALKLTTLILAVYLTGCASVPMATTEDDQSRKAFSSPSGGNAGLYIFRNSHFGTALKKSVYVDGQLVGETAPMTYFYREVPPGERKLSTQSEFGKNDLVVKAEPGRNYFVRQYIQFGVFVGGAGLELLSEEEGKKGVLECKLAN
jgi:Protein of unknown function (DUF2846)